MYEYTLHLGLDAKASDQDKSASWSVIQGRWVSQETWEKINFLGRIVFFLYIVQMMIFYLHGPFLQLAHFVSCFEGSLYYR